MCTQRVYSFSFTDFIVVFYLSMCTLHFTRIIIMAKMVNVNRDIQDSFYRYKMPLLEAKVYTDICMSLNSSF